MADPILPQARIIPAASSAAATVVEAEVMAGEAATGVVAVAINGWRRFTKTGMAAELFPKFFRFIPV